MGEIYKIDSVFKKITKKLRIPDFNIYKIWEEVTGEIISKVSTPSYLEEGVLNVTVKDPIWINQLNLLKDEIIFKINETCGKEVVKDIKYKTGKVKISREKPVDSNYVNLDEIELKEDDLMFIESAVDVIRDEVLKEKFRSFFINALKRKLLDEKKEEE
ncbi:MAG: DUF721 domain-containing protein [Proteobacteria bacterium]|nr:DUF721 domain-containing protein [Pseudomonadota bacterium]